MRRDINSRNSGQGNLNDVFITAAGGNLVLAALKLAMGLSGYTKLILMDGVISFINVVLLLLMWQGNHVEQKDPDEQHPYGYGKTIFLITSVAGLLVLILATYMFFYSLYNMSWLEVHRSHSGAMMAVVISIIANELLYRYLMKESSRYANSVLAWSAFNNRIGVFVSSIVLVCIMFSSQGAFYAERTGVLLIALILFLISARILFKAFSGIMDKAPSEAMLSRIRNCVNDIRGVKEILDIKARFVGTFLHVDVCLAVDESLSLRQADWITRGVEEKLLEKMPLIREVNAIVA